MKDQVLLPKPDDVARHGFEIIKKRITIITKIIKKLKQKGSKRGKAQKIKG